MSKLKNHSSLLAKYSLIYEKNSRSRVFAPLAETYRKLGLLDEALRVLEAGIKLHPTYILGYIVLANCYFDLGQFEKSHQTLKPYVKKNLENISMQKLYAKSCMKIGELDQALETYKYLLLFNPKDEEIAEKIKLLEDDLVLNQEPVVEIKRPQITKEDFDEDDWVQVNFSKNEVKEKIESELDEWKEVVSNPLDKFKSEIKSDIIQVKEHGLDDDFFHEEFDNQGELDEKEEQLEIPIITHTLVDLYCKQGHTEKAIGVLENILELHPNDEESLKKLNELKGIQLIPLKTEKVVSIKDKFEVMLSRIEKRKEEVFQ